jgi:hypothetical protein
MTWRKENSSSYRDSNSDPSPVQPVASCYTNCAIPAPNNNNNNNNNNSLYLHYYSGRRSEGGEGPLEDIGIDGRIILKRGLEIPFIKVWN